MKARFIKLKSAKFCILDKNLYWKDLLNYLLKNEVDKEMQEFHEGDCDTWKTTTNKIPRAFCYWPTLFSDVQKKVTSCHKCQIF